MREVENAPMRCPSCQRPQMTSLECFSCEVKRIVAQDTIDILTILDILNNNGNWTQAQTMIDSMKAALETRLNPQGFVNVPSSKLENGPEVPGRDSNA